MDTMRDISDQRVWYGTDLAELEAVLKRLDDMTELIPMNMADIDLLSLNPETPATRNVLSFRRLNPLDGTVRPMQLSLRGQKRRREWEPLIKETKANRLLLLHEGQKYFTASSLASTMATRIGSGGHNASRPSYKRDAYFAELLGVEESDVQLLVRSIGKVHKAFAMHSTQYTLVPQITMMDIIRKIEHGLGKPVCKGWTVSHFCSEVQLEFPERAVDFAKVYGVDHDITPGLKLLTSDVGRSSVCALGTWNFGDAVIGSDIYTRKHRGKVDSDQILKEIDKKIFSKYERIPKALCGLMQIHITDVEAAVDSVFRQIDLSEKIGKKRVDELKEIMESEYNPGLHYTAYDIAKSILSLPARVQGMPKDIQKRFENGLIQAVYADYEESQRKLIAIPA